MIGDTRSPSAFTTGAGRGRFEGRHLLSSIEKNRLAMRISSVMNYASARADQIRPDSTPKGKHRKRKAARTPTFKQAKIKLANGAWATCVITDFDACGCRIKMEGAYSLPDQVEIAIPAISVRRRATVCWRADREAGCDFSANSTSN